MPEGNIKSRIGDLRLKVFKVIDVNNNEGFANRFYDFFSTAVLILNIVIVTLDTVASLHNAYGHIYSIIEAWTVAFFAVDCGLRIWTAEYQYPKVTPGRAVRKYLLSFDGIIDLLSFVPYYIPAFVPTGAVVFRFFRVIRIFRLFRINAYYDSLNVITEVLRSKKDQLLSSVFIILVLMMASSLCMYSLENSAQPEVFSNAFSGIWWSVSTLLTIGYGDIYPITFWGQFFGAIISFLGVGMVAIPTGIISAGFVEQYTRIKKMSDFGREDELNFIKVHLGQKDSWTGKMIRDIDLPSETIISVVIRGNKSIVPRGDVVLMADDIIVIGAESLREDSVVDLKEITIAKQNPWNGVMIRDLDISRRTFIVMIKRGRRSIVPKGDLVLKEGDRVMLYTNQPVKGSENEITEL
ncbi:MAG: ion transporter [Lachnospiraceae bacterium]|nr:ion transporter [Lachnospiraceae bacterium]